MEKTAHNVESRLFSLAWLVCVLFLTLGGCTPSSSTPIVLNITVEADGKEIVIQVPEGTTAQAALGSANITLGNLDRIEPPGYTVLQDGLTVVVTRVREVFNVQEVTIPFEKTTLNNETLPDGQTLLVQAGVNGTEQVTYRQVFENNQEVSNIVFKNEVIQEPVPEIVMVGIQKPFTTLDIPAKLAYLSGGNAWYMEKTTGNRRPVVTTGDLDGRVFKLSPKGDWLLFTRTVRAEQTGNAEIDQAAKINTLWALDLSEENPKPINLNVANVVHFADWVPGQGLTIVYSTVEPRSTAPGWPANNDLQMMSFAASGTAFQQETIIETNAGGFYGWWGTNYTWSPDGALLAYARPDEIGLVDLEGKTIHTITGILPFQTGSDWAWVPGIGWSPDGRILYLVNHVPKAAIESQEPSPLFDMAAITINNESLTPDGPLISVVPQAGMFAYPQPSPTSEYYQVAFLQAIFPEQSDSRRYRLVIMDRDGSNRTVIFPSEDRQGLEPQRITWSPKSFANGHYWIAALYQDNLWLVDAVTGDSQQVTGDGLITCIDWK